MPFQVPTLACSSPPFFVLSIQGTGAAHRCRGRPATRSSHPQGTARRGGTRRGCGTDTAGRTRAAGLGIATCGGTWGPWAPEPLLRPLGRAHDGTPRTRPDWPLATHPGAAEGTQQRGCCLLLWADPVPARRSQVPVEGTLKRSPLPGQWAEVRLLLALLLLSPGTAASPQRAAVDRPPWASGEVSLPVCAGWNRRCPWPPPSLLDRP